ncbi:phosphonate C-P lyase system protein PhnH [Oceanobacillus profundus]|uniref:phosphonate C-P lyase system protein PhnH n=1 Tax=Oceanobacillus TaxID=182709 RepID=UPI0026E1CE66|nr:phosphonate C-P lyase system protein PhnH [Oceanobacillus profundus]MDO6447716.1 phosphonate C-P lyase system protein PhnH [Oceanobacillus profundus]
MAIDHVHDLQFVYKKILDNMSRPGKIASLQTLAGRNDYNLQMLDATLLTIMTLLDREVTFHVLMDNGQNLPEKISEYTLATHTTIDKADFVIVLKGTPETAITNAMTQCKKGSLIDPHASATWIIESAFSDVHEGELMLTGPGIKDQTKLQTALTPAVWQARNVCVAEYPLGIDLMLTDEDLQVVCIPRTTKVDMMEVE